MNLVITRPIPAVDFEEDARKEAEQDFNVTIAHVACDGLLDFYTVSGDEFEVRRCVEKCFNKDGGYIPDQIMMTAIPLNEFTK